MKEIWKPIKGYENLYEVSNIGRVKRLSTTVGCGNQYVRFSRAYPETILKHRLNKHNNSEYTFYSVRLYNNGKWKDHKVHRLVLKAFVPNPDNKPYCNHKDGNTENNRIDNLEWVTAKENVNHAWANGLCKSFYRDANYRKKMSVATKGIGCKPIIQSYPNGRDVEWDSISDAVNAGYEKTNIHRVLNGSQRTHRKCKWKYKPVTNGLRSP
jgi:hypothetical protein